MAQGRTPSCGSRRRGRAELARPHVTSGSACRLGSELRIDGQLIEHKTQNFPSSLNFEQTMITLEGKKNARNTDKYLSIFVTMRQFLVSLLENWKKKNNSNNATVPSHKQHLLKASAALSSSI